MRVRTVAVFAALMMLAVVADHAAAQDASDPAAVALSPASRVRCLDREARLLMEAALAASPTVRREVEDLQSTDLIVGIETHVFEKKRLTGEARITAAAPGARQVRIRIGIPAALPDLVSVLGHELQHALEIAAASDVRDTASLRAHYLRIGYEPTGRGYYETDAAREAGQRVAAELAAPRLQRRDPR